MVPALPRLHRVGHRSWLPTISGGGENPRAARKSWRAAHFPARLGSWVPRRDETDRRNRWQSSLSLEPPGTCVPRALGYNASPSLPGLRAPSLRPLCSAGQSRVAEFTLISGRSGSRGGAERLTSGEIPAWPNSPASVATLQLGSHHPRPAKSGFELG